MTKKARLKKTSPILLKTLLFSCKSWVENGMSQRQAKDQEVFFRNWVVFALPWIRLWTGLMLGILNPVSADD